MECGAFYNGAYGDALKPVGEVEYVNGVAAQSASGLYGNTRLCDGIVGHADLLGGAGAGEVLDALCAAAPACGVQALDIPPPPARRNAWGRRYAPPCATNAAGRVEVGNIMMCNVETVDQTPEASCMFGPTRCVRSSPEQVALWDDFAPDIARAMLCYAL